MIISARTSEIGTLQIANIFLCRQTSSSSKDIARSCFRAWDESYIRLRNDQESTKIYAPEDLNDQKLMEINTASNAALRALPKHLRSNTFLFSVATDFKMGGGPQQRAAWSNLPAWANIFNESRSGDIHQILRSPKPKTHPMQPPWCSWDLTPEDTFLHIFLFQRSPAFYLNQLWIDEKVFWCSRLAPQIAYSNRNFMLSLKANILIGTS